MKVRDEIMIRYTTCRNFNYERGTNMYAPIEKSKNELSVLIFIVSEDAGPSQKVRRTVNCRLLCVRGYTAELGKRRI